MSSAVQFPNGWFIEREIRRNGKVYRQWFRAKDPNAPAKPKKAVQQMIESHAALAAEKEHGGASKHSATPEKATEPKKATLKPEKDAPKEEPKKAHEEPPKADFHTWSNGVDIPKPPPKISGEPPFGEVTQLTKKLPKVEDPWFQPGTWEKKHVVGAYAEADKKFSTLNDAEKAAIKGYLGKEYRIISAFNKGRRPHEILTGAGLNPPKPVPTEDEIRAAYTSFTNLKSAREKLSVENPTATGPLYRGMVLQEAAMHKMLTTSSFTHHSDNNSTSYTADEAHAFAVKGKSPPLHRVMIRFNKVKKGSTAMFEENPLRREDEIIVGQGSFKITGRSWDPKGRTYYIDAEEEG